MNAPKEAAGEAQRAVERLTSSAAEIKTQLGFP